MAWSERSSNQHLGYWTHTSRGGRRIRVNPVYRTEPSIVTDDMLEFLFWHEFLHDVLPGRGHDAEFRRLEMTWPNALELNARCDTLNERWDLDADRHP